MILCDIGNTNLHFYHKGRVWKDTAGPHLADSLARFESEILAFISVNESATNELLKAYAKCFDLSPYIALDSDYSGLGIDRAAACLAINDGVIVDAGSAITVDVMQGGIHLGGFIMPGIARFREMFASITTLDMDFNLSVELDAFPQNTRDALSYGALKPLILTIKDTAKHKRIHFTGGDGKFLSHYFANSFYDELLVFKGLQKIIETHFTAKGIYL